jgi:hypothetical protein
MKVTGQPHAPAALPRGKNMGTYSIGGWIGSRAGLDVSEKRKISFPYHESKPESIKIVSEL